MTEHKTSIHGSPENAARLRANLGLPGPEALAPTDERTYLAGVIRGGFDGLDAVSPDDEDYAIADVVLAADFRRTEVPELSCALAAIERAKAFLTDVSETNEMRNRNAYGALKDITPEPQGEPSDAHLSNVSINGVRQTWEQLYEREHEAHVALQGYRTMLADLDRNASGRHEGDYDSHATGNGGISAGNPHLTTGQVIGYDIGGREYVVPEPRDRGTLSAWVRAAGGVR